MAVRGLAAMTPEREARARSLWKPMRGNLTEIRGGGTVPEAPRDVPSRSEADELLTEGTGATTPGREARAKSLRKPMPQGDWGGKRGTPLVRRVIRPNVSTLDPLPPRDGKPPCFPSLKKLEAPIVPRGRGANYGAHRAERRSVGLAVEAH